MKQSLKICLGALIAAGSLAACQKEEVYDSLVTRDFAMTLDGVDYNIYYGTSNRFLYLYENDGTYLANYSTSYRFALDRGTYKAVAMNQTTLMAPPTNLNEEIIEQDPETAIVFAVSDPITYEAGDPMRLDMKTRTGMLRLRATDVKSDKSYSKVRVYYSTPVIGWSVGQAKPVTGEPLELTREKETTGGIGYTEDAVLIETSSVDEKVNVRLEYLDANSNVVRTKTFDDGFTVLPNEIVEVKFALNNADEPVIMDYTVSIASEDWSQSTIYPSVKVEVPEGYTYVEPGESIDDIFNALAEDESVDEIKLFLKAGNEYKFSATTAIKKPFIIMGQTPGFGQSKATLSFNYFRMTGDLSQMRFENLTLASQNRFFNVTNTQVFHIGEIAMVNCDFNNYSAQIWYETLSAAGRHAVDHVLMEGVTFKNMTSNKNALWNPVSTVDSAMPKWTFRNCVFSGNMGNNPVILQGLGGQTGNVEVVVEGCTFLSSTAGTYSYFILDASKAASAKLTVKDCLIGGNGAGGTWFKLTNFGTVEASGNKCTSGFTMTDWGIDAPAETDQTYQEALDAIN